MLSNGNVISPGCKHHNTHMSVQQHYCCKAVVVHVDHMRLLSTLPCVVRMLSVRFLLGSLLIALALARVSSPCAHAWLVLQLQCQDSLPPMVPDQHRLSLIHRRQTICWVYHVNSVEFEQHVSHLVSLLSIRRLRYTEIPNVRFISMYCYRY